MKECISELVDRIIKLEVDRRLLYLVNNFKRKRLNMYYPRPNKGYNNKFKPIKYHKQT